MANIPGHKIKCACADFYQNKSIRAILGENFHPGGLALTHYLAETVGLNQKDIVLDLASGRGISGVYLAETFGCQVTGLDFGQKNITAAKVHASKRRVKELTNFQRGDAEGIPFADNTFDVVISECGFCTFSDKLRASMEVERVLVPGGRLGMTEITINSPLPENFQTIMGWVSCISGANTIKDYQNILTRAGFRDFIIEDHHDALLDMADEIRKKCLNMEIEEFMIKLETDGFNPGDLKFTIKGALELVEKGIIGYSLIAALKR